MSSPDHVRHNRTAWNAAADEYQQDNRGQIAPQMTTGDIAWGVWGITESELNLLGDVAGARVLELGCGAAQWSLALARRAASPVGLDLSDRQLEHARRSMGEVGVVLPLVQASGEQIPFADATFDLVFADHGAFTFADPYRTIPESARVLRRGGYLTFVHAHPVLMIAWALDAEHPSDRLVADYFGMHRSQDAEGNAFEFNLPFGEWIRLFTENGLVVERLVEPRPTPDATSTYRDDQDRAWALRWPGECIWRARKS